MQPIHKVSKMWHPACQTAQITFCRVNELAISAGTQQRFMDLAGAFCGASTMKSSVKRKDPYSKKSTDVCDFGMHTHGPRVDALAVIAITGGEIVRFLCVCC